MKKQNGFTLIEILITLSVLLITLAGGVVVLPAIRQVWEKVLPTPSPAPTLHESKAIPSLHKESGKTWVKIDPIQCFWNPWEKDWLQSHGNDSSKYPRGDPVVVEQAEKEIIKEYYGRQRITVFDIKSAKFENLGTCTACGCPQGYTLFLLVSDTDVQKMIEWGYQKTQ